ncbi:MAG: hypothetical protein KKG14_07400 [Alphaproteobacteria bacterium]|nr:hypothetical protein [Alphaproteobacteria bacterium]MBU2269782.1 hypothetical protein [Alphaproteobacteria bacterium]MBU2418512.1 hypothetical protein [Alphaproteobacteria bacterium]
MSSDLARPDACLSDAEFDALSRGELGNDALDRLRAQVQAVLDDPSEGVSHDAVWSRLEQRMKRAAHAA